MGEWWTVTKAFAFDTDAVLDLVSARARAHLPPGSVFEVRMGFPDDFAVSGDYRVVAWFTDDYIQAEGTLFGFREVRIRPLGYQYELFAKVKFIWIARLGLYVLGRGRT